MKILWTTPEDHSREGIEAWLEERAALCKRLDEENMVFGALPWSPAVCMTHEITGDWRSATASRFYEARMRADAEFARSEMEFRRQLQQRSLS